MNKFENILTNGVVFLENVMSNRDLDDYFFQRNIYIKELERNWCDGIRDGSESPTFYDDIELRKYSTIYQKFVHTNASKIFEVLDNSFVLREARVRFVAPYPLGYLNWHVDHFEGKSKIFKAIIYLTDTPRGCGEFNYVQGSHRLDSNALGEWTAMEYGYTSFPGRAGSCVLFDSAGLHAPEANSGIGCRETLILKYTI